MQFAFSSSSGIDERSKLAAGQEKWVILNLGCGTKTSQDCINIDWSATIRLVTNPLLRACAPHFLNEAQMEKVRRLDRVTPHDLRKGIPYPNDSVDAVYHSHILEHIDRDSVMGFLVEIRRVLKPGAVHRIVVPDLERLARQYLDAFEDAGSKGVCTTDWRRHDLNIKEMIEQMVRRRSAAVCNLGPLRREIESFVFGDARRRGETHQWMYDRINLPGLLTEAGFREITQVDYNTSRIPRWHDIGLDLDFDRLREYKAQSIYFESIK
jgi:SAM-dependent methyltransferase